MIDYFHLAAPGPDRLYHALWQASIGLTIQSDEASGRFACRLNVPHIAVDER